MLIALVIVGIIGSFIPTFYVNLLSLMLVYAIFAMSLDIIAGYTGLISLGHAAFFGISAYAVALMHMNNVFPSGPVQLVMDFVVGIGSATILAFIFGLLTLRSRSDFFLMLTFALSMMLWGIAFKWDDVTKGYSGIGGVYQPALDSIGLNISTPHGYLYFVIIFFAIAAALMYYILIGSSFGRVLLGIKQNELRMRTLGFNVWLYIYVAYIFSGFFAGLSGVLFVYQTHFVGPLNLHLLTSGQVLLMAIFGGIGTLFGPALGAGVIIFLKDFISSFTPRWVMVLGLIYILVVIFIPNGIYESIMKLPEIVHHRLQRHR